MKKMLTSFITMALAFSLSACGFGTIETGQVGVVTSFNGKIDTEEVNPGIYFKPFQKVDHYTIKEFSVVLDSLTPKAADNLTMHDVDVIVYVSVDATQIAEFTSKYAGQSKRLQEENFIRPGYNLIESLGKGAVSSEVFKHDSMKIGGQRDTLEKEIMTVLNTDLPPMFKITRVVAASLLPDESIEDSIRKNAAKENELAAATKEIQVKDQLAQANVKFAASLTPYLLQHEYIVALNVCAQRPGCTMINGGSPNMILNIPKN